MKNKKHIKYIMMAAVLSSALMISGCSEDFLKPDPLSFYEPSKTFRTKEGLESALATCDKHLRNMYFHWQDADGAPFVSENLFSEMVVNGTTDQPSIPGVGIDLVTLMQPTATDNASTIRYTYFWSQAYAGIKYANSIITNIDYVEGLDPKLHDEMLGRAYFHRAYRYFNTVFQYKDIPLFTREVQGTKFDYKSTKRSVILDMITKDLEYAVQNVPEVADYGGMIDKGTCRHLLIKCYLATGQFDKAIEEANILINNSGYALMTENFGTFINPMPDVHPVTRNVIWDLHRPENKMASANKEAIFCMISRNESAESSIRLKTMRNAVPFWPAAGAIGIMTPNGKQGMDITTTYFNYKKTYGRGVARMRPTNYNQYTLWVNDSTDLRHSVKHGNWMVMENFKYNHPKLFSEGNEYAGKNIRLYGDNGELLCSDTIRNWFNWPHYKTWVEDPNYENSNNYEGGEGDWYMFRLAETYLLRAEAYMWKGDVAKAAEDVNTIRKRSQCSILFTPGEMNMGVIMDERARELYLEEWRHVELSRVSYIFALTGQTDEFGKTYTEEKLSDDSYWWQRICKYNNFYNSGIKTRSGVKYTIAPYHIFFPIPQGTIDANREGRINQNKGYAGYEYNVTPFDNLEEAKAAELDYTN